MICRLVLSLKKASDPNVIRAWNVDHFSTQSESLSSVGVALTPIFFYPPTITETEGNGSTIHSRCPPDNYPGSPRRTIDEP